MANYFTVVIPWCETVRTPWHPTTSIGAFATLTRGAFATEADAVAWAQTHLNGAPYTVRFINNA